MLFKIKEYVKHIVIWLIIGCICRIFAEKYTSYLNIGMGLGLGIICMGIVTKIDNSYGISNKAKHIVDVLVMYSVIITSILLLWICQRRDMCIRYNDIFDEVVYICLIKLVLIMAYILISEVVLKEVLNKYRILISGIFIITCAQLYVDSIIYRNMSLIYVSMVISIILCGYIWKKYKKEFYKCYRYFCYFILTRMVENLYVLVSDINEKTLVCIMFFRFVEIYYLLQYTTHSAEDSNSYRDYDTLSFFDTPNNSEYKISCIIANLSHELKTPINVIVSALEIINIENNMDTKVEEEIHVVKKECAVIMDMVQTIADIQKAHDSHDNPNIKKYNIVELVENISDAFNYEYQKGKIIFDTYQEEICVYVNKSLVQQAIMGILHTSLYMDIQSNINICINRKNESHFEIVIASGQIIYIRDIIYDITNKIPIDSNKDNMLHVLSVQLLLEVVRVYKSSIKFKQYAGEQAIAIIMPIDKDESRQVAGISEWDIDELRENIKMKYIV